MLTVLSRDVSRGYSIIPTKELLAEGGTSQLIGYSPKP